MIYFRKIVVVDCFVCVWGVALSFATLSKGAINADFSSIIYPLLFFPALTFFSLKGGEINTRKNMVMTFILFVVLFFGLLSSAYHSDLDMVYSLFAFSLLVLVGVYVYPSIFNQRQKLIFFISAFCFSLVYFSFYVFKYDLGIGTSLQYGNSNTLGLGSATVASLGLGLIFYFIERRFTFACVLFFLFGIGFMVYLTILSASRTAALTIFIVFFVLSFAYFFRNRGRDRVVFIISVFVIGVVFIYFFGDVVFESIVEKFENKKDDVLSGRGVLWQFVISNTGLFGLGMNFFRYDAFIAAHSTYVSFLGRYGWLMFFSFSLLLFYILVCVFKLIFVRRNNGFGYIYISVFLGFVLMSFTEIMIFKSIMVYSFLFLGDYLRSSEV